MPCNPWWWQPATACTGFTARHRPPTWSSTVTARHRPPAWSSTVHARSTGKVWLWYYFNWTDKIVSQLITYSSSESLDELIYLWNLCNKIKRKNRRHLNQRLCHLWATFFQTLSLCTHWSKACFPSTDTEHALNSARCLWRAVGRQVKNQRLCLQCQHCRLNCTRQLQVFLRALAYCGLAFMTRRHCQI